MPQRQEHLGGQEHLGFLACSGAEVLVWSVLDIPKCGVVLSLVVRASIQFTLQCSKCLLSANAIQGLRESLSLPCNNVFSMIMSVEFVHFSSTVQCFFEECPFFRWFHGDCTPKCLDVSY